MDLSAWAYHRGLKLARTIADLAGSERIQPAHIAAIRRSHDPVSAAKDGVGCGMLLIQPRLFTAEVCP